MIDSKVIDAFHCMWGIYPDPVMLVHKSREILAINETCSKHGSVVGIKCSSIGDPERHKGCLADQVLASQQPLFAKWEYEGNSIIRFWLPVVDHADIFVHGYIRNVIDPTQ